MIAERLGVFLRRAVAWWIDAFLVAAIVTVVRWVINALADAPLAGRPEEVYEAVALAVAFPYSWVFALITIAAVVYYLWPRIAVESC